MEAPYFSNNRNNLFVYRLWRRNPLGSHPPIVPRRPSLHHLLQLEIKLGTWNYRFYTFRTFPHIWLKTGAERLRPECCHMHWKTILGCLLSIFVWVERGLQSWRNVIECIFKCEANSWDWGSSAPLKSLSGWTQSIRWWWYTLHLCAVCHPVHATHDDALFMISDVVYE